MPATWKLEELLASVREMAILTMRRAVLSAKLGNIECIRANISIVLKGRCLA
jgi:hypothetical protein